MLALYYLLNKVNIKNKLMLLTEVLYPIDRENMLIINLKKLLKNLYNLKN